MRPSFFSVLLASGGPQLLASAATLPLLDLAPALPLEAFKPNPFVKPLTLEEALAGANNDTESEPEILFQSLAAAATCANPRFRYEWDGTSDSDKQAFINAVKCLMGKPSSGAYPGSMNRYEDLVVVHQGYTPNVHGNAKFLLWHRYFLWTFEDILRTECGYTANLPWFDETKYAGRFSQSSIFSSQWLGAVALNPCVPDGQFANLALNVGPGPREQNTYHCLARAGDPSKTANTGQAMVDACNSRNGYADMAACAEGGAHAWGHNGIGAVMQDVYASPSDPVFWLHHMFIDRNFRVWQNANAARVQNVDGTDAQGNPFTMDTTLYMNGLRPDVKVRDVINTLDGLDGKLCYRYNY